MKIATVTCAALAAVLLAAGPAVAKEQAGGEHKLSAADQQFLTQASMNNLSEVHLGILAASHGSTEAVREFGRWMISTHSFANRELSNITERLHGERPLLQRNGKVDETMGKLQNLSGAAFDKGFLQAMAANHDQDEKLIGTEAKDGQDPLVKSFAAAFLPTIDEHFAQVKLLMADANGQGQADAERAANMKSTEGGMTGTPKGNNDQAKAVQRQRSGQ